VFISLFIFLLLCCLLLTDIAMVLWITMAIEASYVHRHVLLRLPRHLRLQIRWPRAVSFTPQGPHGRVSLLWSLQWCMSMLLQAPTAPSQSWSPVIRTSVTRRRYRQGGTRDQLAPSSTTNLSMKLSAYTVFSPKKYNWFASKSDLGVFMQHAGILFSDAVRTAITIQGTVFATSITIQGILFAFFPLLPIIHV